MKKLFLILVYFLPLIAFAEYNGHQIKFEINFKDGSKIIGYNYLSLIHHGEKTISYAAYLEQHYDLLLNNHYNDSVGDFTFFENRIKYNYSDYDDTEMSIHTLTGKKHIDTTNIKSVKIIELIDQSYAIGISSVHKWEDRTWMSTEPVEKYSFGGFFCSNDIYIHNKTKETDRIIKLLEEVKEENDEIISRILLQFNGMNVVIISMCTC